MSPHLPSSAELVRALVSLRVHCHSVVSVSAELTWLLFGFTFLPLTALQLSDRARSQLFSCAIVPPLEAKFDFRRPLRRLMDVVSPVCLSASTFSRRCLPCVRVFCRLILSALIGLQKTSLYQQLTFNSQNLDRLQEHLRV